MGAQRTIDKRRRTTAAVFACMMFAPAALAQTADLNFPDVQFPTDEPVGPGSRCTTYSESKPAVVDPGGANGSFATLEDALIQACPYSHVKINAGVFRDAQAGSVRITEPVTIIGSHVENTSNNNDSIIYYSERKMPCVEVALADRFSGNELVRIEHINWEPEEGSGNRTEACVVLKRGRLDLRHNTIVGTFTAPGILLDGGQATIDNNNVAVTAVGIQVNPGSEDHLIINNDIEGNERGIRIISDDHARIVDNRVAASILEGIRLDGAGGVISGNFIELNGGGGLYISGPRAAGVSLPEIRSNVIAINNVAGIVSDPSADAFIGDNTICTNKSTFKESFPDTRFRDVRWLDGSGSLAGQKDNNFVFGHKGDKRVSGFWLGGEKLSCPPRGTRGYNNNTAAFRSSAPPPSSNAFGGEAPTQAAAASGTPTPLRRPEQ